MTYIPAVGKYSIGLPLVNLNKTSTYVFCFFVFFSFENVLTCSIFLYSNL